MIRKYHNHTLHMPTHGTLRKSHRILIVTRHQEDNQSKATSFLFPNKMVAKLERTLNNLENGSKYCITKQITPTNNGINNEH